MRRAFVEFIEERGCGTRKAASVLVEDVFGKNRRMDINELAWIAVDAKLEKSLAAAWLDFMEYLSSTSDSQGRRGERA